MCTLYAAAFPSVTVPIGNDAAVRRPPPALLIVCGVLFLAVAGCGGSKKKEQPTQLRVRLNAVPNKLPGKWDAAVKVTWDNARSGRRLAVPLPKNGTVDVFTIPGTAVYRMSILIEPVDHSSASGTCQRNVPLLPQHRVDATIHVTSRGSCSISLSPA